MSLGIFSFDLAAIINSLSNLAAAGEQESAPSEVSLEKTEDVLQNASAAVDSVIDEVLIAAALNSSVTPVISTKTEIVKSPPEKIPAPKPAAVAPLDEDTRKEIERLIKSLQTTVIHNYKSSDLIDETVSLNTITNFAQGKRREDGGERESVEQQKKRDERRLEILREELKRAILKHNRDV